MNDKQSTTEDKVEKKESIFSKAWFRSVAGIIVIFLLLGIFIFWRATVGQIKIENSLIDAPIIALSPATPNTLEEIYVKAGDVVQANTPVAKVGSETLTSKVAGIIVSVNHQEGQIFTPGQAVVSMINIAEERVVGKIDEDKGLSKVKIGQKATFTVDAFGNKKYVGVVDEVSPISDTSGIVFNISDKRAVKQFDIKVLFDTKKYPELKEGMSAKITIFTN